MPSCQLLPAGPWAKRCPQEVGASSKSARLLACLRFLWPLLISAVTHSGSSTGGMKGLHLAEPNDLGAETPPASPWRGVGQQESPAAQLQWPSTKGQLSTT